MSIKFDITTYQKKNPKLEIETESHNDLVTSNKRRLDKPSGLNKWKRAPLKATQQHMAGPYPLYPP